VLSLSGYFNPIKIHKNENFFGFDFEFFTISYCKSCINNKISVKNLFDWTIMGGATIIPRSLKTTRNEKNFQDRLNIFLFFKSYMTLKYLLIIDFPKFDPLTAAEMALCGNLGLKCQNLFPLVSD
jgi:hypothetical protein